MTISKGISVVLTLDDSGFSQKTIKAKEATKSLEIGFTGLGKATENIENSIGTLSKSVSSFSSSFDAMQKSLDAVAKKMQESASRGFTSIDKSAKESAKVSKNTATEIIDVKIKTLDSEIETNKKMLESRKQTFQQMQALAAEERRKSDEALNRAADAEKRLGAFGGKNVIAQNMGDALRHDQNAAAIDRELAAVERWVASYRTEQAARTSGILALQQERQAAVEAAKAKETLANISKAVGERNAKEVERVSKMALQRQRESEEEQKRALDSFGRYKKSLNDQELADARRLESEKRRAANESIAAQQRAARQAAQEAREYAREQAKIVSEMWKGMAQAYAGAKIGQGLTGSVNSAKEYERQQYSVKTLNLSKDENDYIEKKSWDESKQLKFVSATDQIKARMAMIGGLAHNDVGMIDKLMPDMAKAAFNIRTMTGDKSADGYENMVRNLTGVIEARQQTDNPEAARRTIELVQKIYTGTGRKIDIADIETYFRRDGTGADKISDEGLAKVVAFMDQAKVSGGHGGGGAGVSTVGTMVKMFQKMANGGTMTVEGAKNFAESGLMDMSVTFGKEGQEAMRALRHGGLKVADLSGSDPVGALQVMAQHITKFVSSDKNKKKYFGDADVNDEDALKAAFMRFATEVGWSTNATTMLTTAGNKSAMKRADNSAKQIMNGMGVDQANAEAMKTLAANVDVFTASWENLKVVLGNSVLPIVTNVMKSFTAMMDKLTQYGKDNPMAAQMTMIGGAVAGVVLSLKGMIGIFGSAMKITDVFSGMVSPAKNANAAVGTLAESSKKFLGAFDTAALNKMPVFGADIGKVASSAAGLFPHLDALPGKLGTVSGAVGGTAGKFATGFASMASSTIQAGAQIVGVMGKIGVGMLQIVPIIGQLASLYLLTDWLANLEIGGATIGAWVMGFCDRIVTRFKIAWLEIRELFSTGAKSAAFAAEAAAEESALKARLKANGLIEDKSATKKAPLNVAQQEEEYLRKEREDEKKAEEEKKKAERDAKNAKEIADMQAAAKTRVSQIEAGSKRENREHTDPLVRALETVKGSVEATKVKLSAIYSDAQSLNTLRKEVMEELEGRRLAGDFDHDQKHKVAANNPKYLELVEMSVQRKVQEEQLKAVQFANERVAATAIEADSAMERLAGDNAEKTSDAFRALERELSRMEKRLGLGKDALNQWSIAKNKAFYNQAVADAGNYASDLDERTKKNNLDNIPSEQMRAQESIRIENEKEQAKYNLFVKNLDTQFAARERSLAAETNSIEEFEAKWLEISAEYAERRKLIEDAHSEFLESKAIADARALRSPMEAMVENWEDSTKAMQQAQAQWSESFVSMITSSMTSGKLEVGNFVKYVLQSILDAQLKAALAKPLSSIMGGVSSFVSGFFGGSSSGIEGAPGFMGPVDTPFAFANGGIMTDFGPLELKKYANGGIANSPQLALFGEAGPEAYVPLPDGRSIPVTLNANGAGASGQTTGQPSVTVNVINQTGQQANAQEGQMRFDGKQYILDVVLTAAHQPGGFRNGLKEAVK